MALMNIDFFSFLFSEDDIVPFDKDELCKHIDAGGGMILDKFDDYKVIF